MATAVVTGAGRGIGREVALRLADRGYDVLATDIDEGAAAETAEAIGARGRSMGHDVRDAGSHRAVAAAAQERGSLAVWVNNAGVLRTNKAWEHTDDDVRLLAEANFLGTVWGSRAAVEAMGERGGHVVNLASMSAFGPVPGLAVYGATKHAVLGFTLSLQGDLDEAGLPIRTHAVCPDGVGTRMVEERVDDPDSAIIFSAGADLLDPAEVAERIMGLLDSKTMLLTIPRYRAGLARFAGRYPRAGLALLAVFKKLGERNRERAAARA